MGTEPAFRIAMDGEDYGEFTRGEILAHFREGSSKTPRAFYLAPGAPDWLPLGPLIADWRNPVVLPPALISAASRAEVIEDSVKNYLADGWVIATRTESSVHFRKPKVFNAGLAIILFVFSCGLGLLVYAFAFMIEREITASVTVGQDGRMTHIRDGKRIR